MEIRSNAILFPSNRGGISSGSASFTFARQAVRAVAAMTGYSATYENDHDHHLGQLDMSLNTTIDPADPRTVHVDGTFGLRDWSGNWDDAYSGIIDIALFAELVPVTPPGPGESRGDLVITDTEITQGIQHFRSAKHLNSANVFPDNSIRLVANKATGVRVWVDYDKASGLLPIGLLTGTLSVTSGPIPRLILPLNKIVPRRETQLNRALADDTLNFVLPEDVCRGDVTISVQVRDNSDITQFSATFDKTLKFETMPVVRVFDVGINYTGPDTLPNLPTGAPGLAEFASLFHTTVKLYPIAQVAQTGFMTIDYDKEMRSNILKGCDRLKDLRQALKDLRGDSTDIFYGLLNEGVDTGTVRGCGGGGGAAVSKIGPSLAPHEIGHVFGRQHAPCDNVTRCNRPVNTDDNYPDYSGYDSDSIGEFGFDTSTGMILDPGNAHDIMGYSDNDWISPYTYKALMTRIPIDNGGVASGASARRLGIVVDEGVPGLSPHLFISFTIQRDRTIQWHPAFHFPTPPQQLFGRRTAFVIEQRDAKGEVLFSECLYEESATCGCSERNCVWPKSFSLGIPFDPQAKLLVILECEKPLMERAIPDLPKVELTCTGGNDPAISHIACSWTASDPAGGVLWYLLQWQDGNGVWRGVAPRTTTTNWLVPKSLWGKEKVVSLRVLATSDIATGSSTYTGPLAKPKQKRGGFRKVDIQLAGVRAEKQRSVPLPPIIEAIVVGEDRPAGRESAVQWFGSRGEMLSRGRSLQLHVLPIGIHPVRAVVQDRGDGEGSRMFVVERTRDGQCLLRRGTIRYPADGRR